MIKVRNISKRFKKVQAVNNVSLDIKKGEIVCLIGPSGSGKSTVLRCINGLETPESGEIYINGELYDKNDKVKYQELRSKMGKFNKGESMMSRLEWDSTKQMYKFTNEKGDTFWVDISNSPKQAYII